MQTKFSMCMPSMVEPVANVFQSPLFFFSSSASQNFPLHFWPPDNNPSIFIATATCTFRTQRPSAFSFPHYFEELEILILRIK
ncbi:hypothetical protein VP01_265g7 [Puccinia sorghi]|uniref:Uncharacterized protein n=1 Tax=Puccinia sorghi TaxID=27349 RepID=A0A0L6V5V1_9BASI|nr:hypothetical protein VP01_265g7 [Puccinia sorghi]